MVLVMVWCWVRWGLEWSSLMIRKTARLTSELLLAVVDSGAGGMATGSRKAGLKKVQLKKAQLKQAKLKQAQLKKVERKKTRLKKVQLRKAQIPCFILSFNTISTSGNI
jgi:hypothetical protein